MNEVPSPLDVDSLVSGGVEGFLALSQHLGSRIIGSIDGQGAPVADETIYGFQGQPTRSQSFNAKSGARYFVTLDAGNFECEGGLYGLRVDGPLISDLTTEASPVP